MIKAVCFDLDGVYFTSESFKRFKASLPKEVSDKEEVDEVFHGSLMMKFKSGKISEEDFWKLAREKLKISVDNGEIFKVLRASYEINQEVKDYVEKVKFAGFKTCICSNNFVTRVRELDKKFSFTCDFEVAVFSYEVGVTKPDKRIFQELIKQADVKPQELVYSDDTESKLQGAIDLGIEAFVYENFEQFQNKLKELGVNI